MVDGHIIGGDDEVHLARLVAVDGTFHRHQAIRAASRQIDLDEILVIAAQMHLDHAGHRFERIFEQLELGAHPFRLDLTVFMPVARAGALEVVGQRDRACGRILTLNRLAGFGELLEQLRR